MKSTVRTVSKWRTSRDIYENPVSNGRDDYNRDCSLGDAVKKATAAAMGAVSSTNCNTVNDIPELASEPAAAFRCKPEVEFETHGFFEADCSSAKQSRSGRFA